MTLPDHMQHLNMSFEQRKIIEKMVLKKREIMSELPSFATAQEAIKRAISMARAEKYGFPSVWKEPQDLGNRYVVVLTKDRANAINAGYAEAVSEQFIFDLASKSHGDESWQHWLL